jgi:hypothetical protein
MWGYFPDSAEEEAHCCLEQSGRPLILIYLGKRKEKLSIGGKRVSRLNI